MPVLEVLQRLHSSDRKVIRLLDEVSALVEAARQRDEHHHR